MTFDGDLIEEVRAEAPPGVHFEDDEIQQALVRAVNGAPIIFGTAVQNAAVRVIRERRGKAAGLPS